MLGSVKLFTITRKAPQSTFEGQANSLMWKQPFLFLVCEQLWGQSKHLSGPWSLRRGLEEEDDTSLVSSPSLFFHLCPENSKGPSALQQPWGDRVPKGQESAFSAAAMAARPGMEECAGVREIGNVLCGEGGNPIPSPVQDYMKVGVKNLWGQGINAC